jgi:hypothetical protein
VPHAAPQQMEAQGFGSTLRACQLRTSGCPVHPPRAFPRADYRRRDAPVGRGPPGRCQRRCPAARGIEAKVGRGFRGPAPIVGALPSARACLEKRRSRPVSRVLSWTVIPLGASSPIRSSNLPGDTAGRGIASLFGLAPGGVCRAGPLPDSRCALTAPFHPCLISEEPSAVSFCCTFRRLAPPRRYLAPCPVEPGLSSACLRMTRLPGRLRRAHCRTHNATRLIRRRRAPCGARRSARRRAWPPARA